MPVKIANYKSIEVKHGDTLWNIAETYMDDRYDSVAEYVNVLKVLIIWIRMIFWKVLILWYVMQNKLISLFYSLIEFLL